MAETWKVVLTAWLIAVGGTTSSGNAPDQLFAVVIPAWLSGIGDFLAGAAASGAVLFAWLQAPKELAKWRQQKTHEQEADAARAVLGPAFTLISSLSSLHSESPALKPIPPHSQRARDLEAKAQGALTAFHEQAGLLAVLLPANVQPLLDRLRRLGALLLVVRRTDFVAKPDIEKAPIFADLALLGDPGSALDALRGDLVKELRPVLRYERQTAAR